jgi:hypothetical protein
MKYAMICALLLTVAACGGDVVSSSNQAVTPPTSPKAQNQVPTQTPTSSGSAKTAPNRELVAKYNAAYTEARAAVRGLNDNLNAKTYAHAGALCYKALTIGIEYERSGHDTADLRNRKNMIEWFKIWKDKAGQLSMADKQIYRDEPEYKEAFEAYRKLGGN